jgi:cytochrome P450 family 142 subfamily A polypeptide 1
VSITAPPTVDLLDPDLYAGDPHPTYRWLRDEAPCYRDEANALWGISRHADVLAVEKNTRLYSSAHGSRPHIPSDTSMINKDDPDHHEQRRLVARRFTPRAVGSHEDHVRAIVTELIDAVAAKGACDVVEDLASRLPALMICDLLGFDRSLWAKCREWSETTMTEAGLPPDRQSGRSMEAVQEYYAATMELIAARRADPRDDLVSVWCHAEIDGRPMEDAEILAEAILLLDGGAETTRTVIGSTVLALVEHPEQRRLLLDDPGLLGTTAVEEFIRWVTPILNMRRTATAEHELHGQRIAAGDEILLVYGAANRDERVFADPDRFDVTRQHNHHVAFGFGTHFCLGASLARLEIRVMFEELLRRIPDFRLAPGPEPRRVPGFFTCGLESLHIEFTPS